MARTYSCVSFPSSSEPESIALHEEPETVRDPADTEAEAEVEAVGAIVAETCVETGALKFVDMADDAEAVDGLRSRREELAVLREVDGVGGSLRDGARLEEGSARATEVSIRRWDAGNGMLYEQCPEVYSDDGCNSRE